MTMHDRASYTSDHEFFRQNARRFFREELEPNIDQWEKAGQLPRDFWLKAREKGFHCCLIIVETDRGGFSRGRNLGKVGQKAADTSEMWFADVRVPVENLLGKECGGFRVLMNELPRERITIACRAFAAAQRACELTVDYVKERKAFGKSIFDFQNTQFSLAEMKTSLAVGWAYLDQCLMKINDGRLTPEKGAMARLWTTETGNRIIDDCLQFFGGYGYMSEYPISRL